MAHAIAAPMDICGGEWDFWVDIVKTAIVEAKLMLLEWITSPKHDDDFYIHKLKGMTVYMCDEKIYDCVLTKDKQKIWKEVIDFEAAFKLLSKDDIAKNDGYIRPKLAN